MPQFSRNDSAGGPGASIDAVYEQAIKPAIEAAGMEAWRAQDGRNPGILDDPGFEQFLLCEFAVVHLASGSPNILYALGVRHAARPASTLAIFAENQKLPFDVSRLRSLPYELGPNSSFTSREAGLLRTSLEAQLVGLRKAAGEMKAASSLDQLLNGTPAPGIARLKTDVFRDRARYSTENRNALAIARHRADLAELETIERNLGPLELTEVGVLVDILLSYRAVGAWESMLGFYSRMPLSLQRTVLAREQYGFALNRVGRWQEAVGVLEKVIAEHGRSSENLSILGRVYKDLWTSAEKSGNHPAAQDYLRKAIDAYMLGFETDWRDAYPGINALIMLLLEGGAEAERRHAELLPVVTFAVRQRLKSANPDYWDYATLLELAVLQSNEKEARQMLSEALSHVREDWEPKSTAINLSLIREAKKKRGPDPPWLDDVISSLRSHSTPEDSG